MTKPRDRVDEVLGAVRRVSRDLATPEGITLPVEIAGRGERLAAFLLDLVFWLAATAFCYFLIALILLQGRAVEVAITLVLFIAFLLRNGYFIWFELNWAGATPGKRIMKIRVIDRAGGPLAPIAVVARNLTRELEVFIPAGLLLTLDAGQGAGQGAAAWRQLALLAWCLMLSGLPLVNRDRLRIGDLIAGTMVIAVPQRLLMPDLSAGKARFAFTNRQLASYGTFELQVLEELLRRPASPATLQLWNEVAGKICRRIGWAEELAFADVADFLHAFYTAERAWLEREKLFGRVHADKAGAGAAT